MRKLDRMTMRYSVEGRVPFAARSVVKLAARIPYSQLVTSNSLKYLLRGIRTSIARKHNKTSEAWV